MCGRDWILGLSGTYHSRYDEIIIIIVTASNKIRDLGNAMHLDTVQFCYRIFSEAGTKMKICISAREN